METATGKEMALKQKLKSNFCQKGRQHSEKWTAWYVPAYFQFLREDGLPNGMFPVQRFHCRPKVREQV